jgi:hypothetical protein
MARGDHIYVRRFGYTHHGIDCGDDTVIHYVGALGEKINAVIRRTARAEFLRGVRLETRSYGKCDPADVVLERAESHLDETQYHLFFNNCEHFAVWCKIGKHTSEQVKRAASIGGGTVGAGSVVAGGIGVVSATGSAAGLSGAGVMSGLAAVGGTAVGGIVVVGTAPAVVSALAMRVVLKDDPILHEDERAARKAGRVATTIGAAAGSAAAIGTVSAAGTVAGLSGAGIASGLAAIGSTVGGGMVTGVAVTAAAPAVAAAALGYGVYRAWKWLAE